MPIIEPDIVAEHGDEDVEEAGGEVRERPQVRPRGGARGPEAVARQSTREAEDNLPFGSGFSTLISHSPD